MYSLMSDASMNTNEVDRVGRVIERTLPSTRYLGCLMVDSCLRALPSREDENGNCFVFSVVNVLPSYASRGKMGHYLLLAFKGSTVYYFDSFGLPMTLYSPYLARYASECKRMGHRVISLPTRRLQATTSLVCGLYVLQAAYLIAKGGLERFKVHIRTRYTNNYSRNDRTVVRWSYCLFERVLPRCRLTFYSGGRPSAYICRGMP